MTNGVIDLDASTAGTYTITYTTSGACPASSMQDVTITAPTTDFNYGGNTVFCQGGLNPVATITGDTAGIFTSSSGLVIDSITGEIDLTTSTPGNYEVIYNSNSWVENGDFLETYPLNSTSIDSLGDRIVIGAFNYFKIFDRVIVEPVCLFQIDISKNKVHPA